MKKILSMIIAAAMLLTLAACGGTGTPRATVRTLCEGMKDFDYKKIAGTIEESDESAFVLFSVKIPRFRAVTPTKIIIKIDATRMNVIKNVSIVSFQNPTNHPRANRHSPTTDRFSAIRRRKAPPPLRK